MPPDVDRDGHIAPYYGNDEFHDKERKADAAFHKPSQRTPAELLAAVQGHRHLADGHPVAGCEWCARLIPALLPLLEAVVAFEKLGNHIANCKECPHLEDHCDAGDDLTRQASFLTLPATQAVDAALGAPDA